MTPEKTLRKIHCKYIKNLLQTRKRNKKLCQPLFFLIRKPGFLIVNLTVICSFLSLFHILHIKSIAKTVTNQHKSKHHQHDSYSGNDSQMR
jgi:hypothetical protein